MEALSLPAADMLDLVDDALRPIGFVPGDITWTETGLDRAERMVSTRVTSVENVAAGGTEVPVTLAAEGTPATALIRRAVTVA